MDAAGTTPFTKLTVWPVTVTLPPQLLVNTPDGVTPVGNVSLKLACAIEFEMSVLLIVMLINVLEPCWICDAPNTLVNVGVDKETIVSVVGIDVPGAAFDGLTEKAGFKYDVGVLADALTMAVYTHTVCAGITADEPIIAGGEVNKLTPVHVDGDTVNP